MFFGNTQSTLGFLTLDVLVTENINLPSEVTKYPVEDGGPDVSDHITQGNEELTITGSVSSAEAWSFSFDTVCHSKMIKAVDTLRRLHSDRKVIKVVTGLGVYEDMGLYGLTINRQSGDKGGNWLDINAQLRKIRKVQLKKADLPAEQNAGDQAKGKTGTTEKKAGSAGNSSPSKVPEGASIGLHVGVGTGTQGPLSPGPGLAPIPR